VTGAKDCHDWAFEIGWNTPLPGIEEGGKGEAILSRKRVAALYKSGSMRSFLDSEIDRQE
jgi:hypothetical protein